jgi:Rubicon Homology Domain
VVHRWDFTKHLVCERAYERLNKLRGHAIVNLLVHNFQIYCDIPSMDEARKIRERLLIVRDYLMSCRHRRTLLMSVAGRKHLLNEVHLYSLQDLEDARANRLVPYLTDLYRNFQDHIVHCEVNTFVAAAACVCVCVCVCAFLCTASLLSSTYHLSLTLGRLTHHHTCAAPRAVYAPAVSFARLLLRGVQRERSAVLVSVRAAGQVP